MGQSPKDRQMGAGAACAAAKGLTGVSPDVVICAKLMKRKILIILSNRLRSLQKPRWLELDSDEKGNIYKQRPLRAQPRQARYDEVWENDEGRSEFTSCFRFKRKYRHKLQKVAGS